MEETFLSGKMNYLLNIIYNKNLLKVEENSFSGRKFYQWNKIFFSGINIFQWDKILTSNRFPVSSADYYSPFQKELHKQFLTINLRNQIPSERMKALHVGP